MAGRPLSLNRKALLVVGGGMALLLAVSLVVLFGIIRHDFELMERDLASAHVERAAHFLSTKAAELATSVADYAIWDETFDFLAGRGRPGYLERNFYDDSKAGRTYDFALFYRSDGTPVAEVSRAQGTMLMKPPPGLDPLALTRSQLFGRDERNVGVFALARGIVFLASHPIYPSDRAGQPNGTLVFGKFFSPEFLVEVEASTDVRLSVRAEPAPPAAARSLSPFRAEPLGQIHSWLDPKSSALPGGGLILKDIDSRPVALGLTFDHPRLRKITHEPFVIIAAATLGGLLVVICGLFLVDWNILRPIRSLDQQMAGVAAAPATCAPIKLGGNREFIRLAASANRMLDVLRAHQSALAEERRLLASVLDTAAEGLIAFRAQRDLDGRIVDFLLVRANPAGRRLLGLDSRDPENWSLRTVAAASPNFAVLWDAFIRATETGEPQHLVIHSALSTSQAWHDQHITRWGDGVVLSFSDVTEQRASLEEIERFNRAMLDREERILQVKREINELLTERGEPPRYASAADP